ncbi:MAG: hypothetical protein WD009_07645 [Phycisphaeraceae bacterium]
MQPIRCGLRIAAVMMLGAALAGASAPNSPAMDDVDRQILEGFLEHTRAVPERISADHVRELVADEAEGLRWRVLPYVEMPLTAYEITGDEAFLDTFVAVFANLEAALTEGPDGYLGWYGKALPIFQDPENPDRPIDVLINSFGGIELVSRFIEHIDADPVLAERYAAERERYLDLATNHLFEKWNARGNYVELGRRGAIYRTHEGLAPTKSHLTQPINKLEDIARGLLALYRVTDDEQYMAQAVRIGTFFKRSLALPSEHYEWTYWTPAGAWDIHPDNPDQWKHWIGAEHRAGYYGSSVALAVELYHHGVVFDETDIERFVNTQLNQAWNGSLDDPQFFRVDRSDGPRSGSYIAAGLAPWSDRLAEFIYAGERRDSRLENAGHPWQGGPAARGWVHGRFVYMNEARDGRQIHAAHGERFRASETGGALLEELEFDVESPGYRAPRTPAEMRPMPGGE